MQSIARCATAAACLPLHRASRSAVQNLTTAQRFAPSFVPIRKMSLSIVSTPDAPAAVGPYNQAIKAGNLLFASGSLGINPATGKLVDGGVEAQTKQALKNMKTVIEAGGATIDKVVKTTVFLADMNDFAAMNAIYAEFFGGHKPARSAVQVARLPLDGRFEIECIVSLA
ncbi:Endoribonuclease L-PSP/chorismate mutase-like protein [Rhodofomes roseus]|uniref:Endoribonuclease L-PSP/chorismate mutase-like protein n=1 Tax=Rhodofomes roseus TaxID=34475 RepID=A0ABQ8KH89_9APHY|nr:Endoribonuclease L-PSP/chorismate mutase-like protein [Rhodofomes roseus]KAH9837230.1 Endoribonuclease L-PSP/chorismate mutase-like protein [Rhodofomes roseus]